MISRISKLKHFGIFHDFTWPKEKEPSSFKKFNLIYGWNRSGKTTISRVFASCEKKNAGGEGEIRQYPKDGEFTIKTSDGKTIKNKDVGCPVPIRVFNQDFVEENISFDPSRPSEPIVYVSEEDIERKNRLARLEKEQTKLDDDYERSKEEYTSAKKRLDNFLTDWARKIAKFSSFDARRNYTRKNLKDRIQEIGIGNFGDKILSHESEKDYYETSKSDERKKQAEIAELHFSFELNDEVIDNFHKIFGKVEELLEKKVISKTLDRLKNDRALNNWVQQGFDLHNEKKEKEKCLFCQAPLAGGFLDKLSRHFSQDYEELQSTINCLKNEISKVRVPEKETNNSDLYPYLQKRYKVRMSELNGCIKKINAWIDEATVALQKKHDGVFATIPKPTQPDDFLTSYNRTIAELNTIISEHNQKADGHKDTVSAAEGKLELHHIAVTIEEGEYQKIESELKDTSIDKNKALIAKNKNQSEIDELEKQTSDIGKAIDKINGHLIEFFGREEIKLELDKGKKGYTIKRSGQPAKALSESEKTAIAFSYFVVKIDEQDFDKSKGVIFIDDPISSFDSNFIYYCYAMIERHFKKDIGQLFISTHNFQFFNLVKRWFNDKNERRKNKSNKSEPCEFFMVENYLDNEDGKPIRGARIVELDKTLKDYESEYHFLFAKLKEFSDSEKQGARHEDIYTIGNIARRFFEIFAGFKVPIRRNIRGKMEELAGRTNGKITDVEITRIYKLLNQLSHNSELINAIEHIDKSEVIEAVKTLLDLVKETDKEHFEILEKEINQTKNA